MTDINLLQFCTTEKQMALVNTSVELGSIAQAARAIGMDESNAHKMMKTIKTKAAQHHYAPEQNQNNPLPAGQTSRGVSQLINEETGKPVLTWYKSKPAHSEAEAIRDILEDFNPKPLPEIKPPDMGSDADLLNLLTITDYHIGSYCWGKQTGDDWDLDIAENVFTHAILDMIDRSPKAKTALLNIQGDYLHWDSINTSVTPTSAHVLDSDSRGGKMIELALDMTIWACQKLLETHEKVHLIVCEGNHDETGSRWLSKAMERIFSDNKRLEVDGNEVPFYAHLHGKSFLGFHHGHKVKNEMLQKVFSGDPRFRELWGTSNYAYIHTGHYHHREKHVDEFGGCVVERHPSLTGRDNYASRLGLASKRAAYCITYHKENGEVSRIGVYPNEQ